MYGREMTVPSSRSSSPPGVHGAIMSKAETNCELYVLYKNDFERILMANHDIAVAIKAHQALPILQ